MDSEKKKEKSKKAFNHQANTYDMDIKGKHARGIYPELLNKLSGIKYKKILDLGCGTGAMLSSIVQINDQKEVFGIDIAENMVKSARKKLKEKAEIIIGDSENLPYEDNFFDVVYCNDSFHHYPKPDKVIAEVSRVLKKEGYFIVGDYWKPLLIRTIMNCFIKFSNEGDIKIYSEAELKKILANRFSHIEWEKVNQSAFICTAIKK